VVGSAIIKRDHVAAELGLVERVFLDRVDDGATCLLRLGWAYVRLDGGVNPLCHILDAHQDIQLFINALEFFVVRVGLEPRLHQVLLQLVAKLLDTVSAHMMVGHDQAVG
jgi:hypothetical protein